MPHHVVHTLVRSLGILFNAFWCAARLLHRERIFADLHILLVDTYVLVKIIIDDDSLALVYTLFRTRITLLKYALFAVQCARNNSIMAIRAQLLHLFSVPKSPRCEVLTSEIENLSIFPFPRWLHFYNVKES